jgi:ribosomal protein S18 acetylase RimI-like enzyme
MWGVYEFKRGFRGTVTRHIGAWDYAALSGIHPPLAACAQLAAAARLSHAHVHRPADSHTTEQAFMRAEHGEIAFLVAEVNGFPAGQVWVNLVDKAESGTGLIWALRVLPPLHNLGIGTQLLHAAEECMQARDLHTAELNVALDNPHAKRLYERCGYQVIQQIISDWQYTTPDGETHSVAEAEYIMHKSLEENYT